MEQEQLESLWLMWQPITRCGKQRIRQIPDNLSAFGIYCPIFYCDTYSIHFMKPQQNLSTMIPSLSLNLPVTISLTLLAKSGGAAWRSDRGPFNRPYHSSSFRNVKLGMMTKERRGHMSSDMLYMSQRPELSRSIPERVKACTRVWYPEIKHEVVKIPAQYRRKKISVKYYRMSVGYQTHKWVQKMWSFFVLRIALGFGWDGNDSGHDLKALR